MKYAGIIENDVVNGEGVCVSLFTQGCPHRCKGCFNSETWDAEGGIEIDEDELIQKIITAIKKNGIQRNFSILGGEPLAPYNVVDVHHIIYEVKKQFPDIKIFIWTGYEVEELIEYSHTSSSLRAILSNIDALIVGRYIEAERDITLKWRGSKNQRILTKQEIEEIMGV